MKTIRLMAFWSWVVLSISFARAEEVAREAKVVAIQGSASINVPGESSKPAAVGVLLPAGSSIHTTGEALVTVQFFGGTVAVIQPGTDVTLETLSVTTGDKVVTKENALLNLRVGSVITSLDPSKKSINNYSIRTPRGIAAARGTVYAVNVESDGSHATVATMAGVVTFYTDKGAISVPFGKFFRSGSDGGDKSDEYRDLAKSNSKLAAELISAIKSISDGIADGTIPDRPGLLKALHDAAGIIDPQAPNPVTLPVTPAGTILPPLDQTIPIVSPAAPTGSPTPPPR